MARNVRERQAQTYRCPHCGDEILRLPGANEFVICNRCRRRYMVMIDPQTQTVAFVDQSEASGTEPLGLPKGSVRALVALGLTVAAAVVAAEGRDLPAALMSLLLTVVGFYYGFRAKASELGDRLYDPTADRERPLFLPSGAIRTLLIVALAVTCGLLISKGKMVGSREQIEFFIILSGLVVGHYFAKFVRFAGAGRGPIGHVKALAVQGITAWLAVIFVRAAENMPPMMITVLCGTVSFYFGSRS